MIHISCQFYVLHWKLTKRVYINSWKNVTNLTIDTYNIYILMFIFNAFMHKNPLTQSVYNIYIAQYFKFFYLEF